MEFGSFDGGEDGDYNGDGFVVISSTFSMQEAFLLERYNLT